MNVINSIFGSQAQSLDLYDWQASLQNVWPNVYTPPAPRFRSIDPKSRLSPKAARLLNANHCLVQS